MARRTTTLWDQLTEVCDDREDLFDALSSLGNGQLRVSDGWVEVGDPPLYVYRVNNRGRVSIRMTPQAPFDSDGLLAHVHAAFEPGPIKWRTLPMVGSARASGSVTANGLQIRTVEDRRETEVRTWPPTMTAKAELNVFFVDVAFQAVSDAFVTASREVRALRDAENFVALTTWPPLERPLVGHVPSNHAWSLVFDDAVPEVRNAIVGLGFIHPELSENHDSRPMPAEGLLPTLQHARFAAGPLDSDPGQLIVPENFARLWEAVMSQTGETRGKLRRSLAWHAAGLRALETETAIMCFVSAIESLLPSGDGKKCGTCGQETHGVTRRFDQFLEEHCANELRHDFRKLVYKFRSRVAHGELRYDMDFSLFSALNDQSMHRNLAWAAARASLLNWLNGEGS